MVLQLLRLVWRWLRNMVAGAITDLRGPVLQEQPSYLRSEFFERKRWYCSTWFYAAVAVLFVACIAPFAINTHRTYEVPATNYYVLYSDLLEKLNNTPHSKSCQPYVPVVANMLEQMRHDESRLTMFLEEILLPSLDHVSHTPYNCTSRILLEFDLRYTMDMAEDMSRRASEVKKGSKWPLGYAKELRGELDRDMAAEAAVTPVLYRNETLGYQHRDVTQSLWVWEMVESAMRTEALRFAQLRYQIDSFLQLEPMPTMGAAYKPSSSFNASYYRVQYAVVDAVQRAPAWRLAKSTIEITIPRLVEFSKRAFPRALLSISYPWEQAIP